VSSKPRQEGANVSARKMPPIRPPRRCVRAGPAAESPDRRHCVGKRALRGLHLLLFLMIGVASVESMKPNSAPELSVYVESQEPRARR